MARLDYYSCDPFRAWNRLEGRPRKAEFEDVFAATVHDPLWFLTRQWQFGEMQGEDTGSAIFSKVLMSVSQITRMKNAGGAVRKFSNEVPLEIQVESIPYEMSAGDRADAAFMLAKSLDNKAAELGVAGYSSKDMKACLKGLYPFDAPETVAKEDSHEDILAGTHEMANETGTRFKKSMHDRYFDGQKAYNKISTQKALSIQSISGGNLANTTFVTQAIDDFLLWYEKTYQVKKMFPDNAWVPERLEYDFDLAFPGNGINREVLSAEEYAGGHLDWYSFDVNLKSVMPIPGKVTPEETLQLSESLVSVIPVEATFAGAPNSRLWQFEDGRIDLGNIHAGTTDITKLVFSEYALLYSNDWHLIPLSVPVGSVSEIKGIIVTDVFGEQSLVKSANQGLSDTWSGWGMFNLSTLKDEPDKSKPVDTRMFLAPALPKSMESDPVEEVRMVRDEMTNMVWAVEVTLPDGAGSTMDASRVARKYSELLAGLESVEKPMVVPDDSAMFRYVLGNTVPENWIPFVPVHLPGSNRSIRLQRASMPRLFNNEFSKVRPRSGILRVGLQDDDQQLQPYFVNEEEVPRAGIHLKGTHQRGRWMNGTILGWYGYKKQTGRGEGSSGLYYDRLEHIKKKS